MSLQHAANLSIEALSQVQDTVENQILALAGHLTDIEDPTGPQVKVTSVEIDMEAALLGVPGSVEIEDAEYTLVRSDAVILLSTIRFLASTREALAEVNETVEELL